MGKNSKKRKRSRLHQDTSDRQKNDFSLGSTVKDLNDIEQSRRKSIDSTTSNQRDSEPSLPQVSAENESAEWEVASRKKKKRGPNGEKTKYPELVCIGKVQAPIKLDELQRLALYVLADGVAPSWIAYRHALHTKKVVMLMVPGLDMDLFNGNLKDTEDDGSPMAVENTPIKPLSNDTKRKNDGEDNPGKSKWANDVSRNNEFELWKKGQSKEITYRGNPMDIQSAEMPISLQPIISIFPQVWPIKAPGDSSMSKVHSPIQAILTAPLPISKDQAKLKGVKPPREGKSFVPVRTPVSHFIHPFEELRETEYPIHPALYEHSEDATTERARREDLGQTLQNGWVDTNIPSLSSTVVPESEIQKGSMTAGYDVYSLDCEMVLTDDDVSSLARISLIDWAGDKVVDELVKPSRPIKNYFTQFSGMTKEKLESVKTTIEDIQTKLLTLLTPTTILLGHSLESDLTALKITHPLCVDTSLIYPHPRGPPLRSSLKFLAQKYLSREIQRGGVEGHDSVEDARAVLDLVKLKCEKGPLWGTSEAQGEPIFRRLARSKDKLGRARTTAIVDYGTPERGFGREATYHISATTDADIVSGVIRAVNGDPDGKSIRGEGSDFTWARLRELESFRGWSNNNRDHPSPDLLHSSTLSTKPTARELIQKVGATVSQIEAIHNALPPCTLFMVYSGTGDPRDLGRLQALQRTYKNEFRVKKWDDLTVKWTDNEEQALKAATTKARNAVAFLAVK